MSRLIRKMLFIAILCVLVFSMIQTASASRITDDFITTEGVNLRNAASTTANIIRTVNTGTTITILNHDPAGWSRIRVNGTEGYIRSDFVTFPQELAPVTFRTTTGVNLRASPNTDSEVLRTINTGVDVEVLTHDPAGWSRVRIDDTVGFIRSDLLLLPIAGAQQITNGPATAQEVQMLQTVGGVNFRRGPSTESDIIRVLSPGTRVEVLSNGSNGWSEVRVNGYTGYIRSDLLGSGPGNVELLTMSQVKPLLRTNVDIPITDVRTGRTFNIRIFSMGSHADVETSTQRDTDIKFEIREQRWSWAARPVWVHIDGRTIAASINGMPHAGDFIAGNGMYGHLCLHFHNTTANNQRYQADLRNAVMEAFNAGR